MAELTTGNRRDVWAEIMQKMSANGESISITKDNLIDAVNAIDTWMNTNAANLNAAIPQPARGALTTSQKALLLQAVVARRYLTGV